MNNSKNMHIEKIRQCFNRAALTYDQYSHPQQTIGSQLVNMIGEHLLSAKTIIDLGCGSGLVTEQLALTLQYQQFYAIDISEKLINQSKNRLHTYDISLLNEDFAHLSFKDKLFDLAFSNMALHWGQELLRTLRHLNQKITEQGMIAFTIPLEGTFSELGSESRNKYYTCEEVKHYLIHSGFEPLTAFNELFIFQYDSWFSAIKSIKATGANYLFNRKNKSLSGKRLLRDNHGPDKHRTEIKTLSYQIGFFIGGKKFHVI